MIRNAHLIVAALAMILIGYGSVLLVELVVAAAIACLPPQYT